MFYHLYILRIAFNDTVETSEIWLIRPSYSFGLLSRVIPAQNSVHLKYLFWQSLASGSPQEKDRPPSST